MLRLKRELKTRIENENCKQEYSITNIIKVVVGRLHGRVDLVHLVGMLDPPDCQADIESAVLELYCALKIRDSYISLSSYCP